MSPTSTASATETGSPPGTAPHPSTPPPANTSATGSPEPEIAELTVPCTSWPSCNSAIPPKAAPSSTPKKQPERLQWKQCAHLNDGCPTWSTRVCLPTRNGAKRQAREGISG